MTRSTWLIAALLPLLASPALGGMPPKGQAKASPTSRLDLADMAGGTYVGDVISDSRGSSQSDVTITVVKIAPNTVSVSSSYPRLPTHAVGLTRAMQTIQQGSGYSTVFLLDLSRRPQHLDINVDGASWSGVRQ